MTFHQGKEQEQKELFGVQTDARRFVAKANGRTIREEAPDLQYRQATCTVHEDRKGLCPIRAVPVVASRCSRKRLSDSIVHLVLVWY